MPASTAYTLQPPASLKPASAPIKQDSTYVAPTAGRVAMLIADSLWKPINYMIGFCGNGMSLGMLSGMGVTERTNSIAAGFAVGAPATAVGIAAGAGSGLLASFAVAADNLVENLVSGLSGKGLKRGILETAMFGKDKPISWEQEYAEFKDRIPFTGLSSAYSPAKKYGTLHS